MQPIFVLAKTLHASLTESLTLKTSSIRIVTLSVR